MPGKEQYLIFSDLKKFIEACDGSGFHNRDLGHPVNRAGASRNTTSGFVYAGSPTKLDRKE